MIGSELVPLDFTSAIKLLIHDVWNSERAFDQKAVLRFRGASHFLKSRPKMSINR